MLSVLLKKFMRISRRLFRNTPIQKWKFTTAIYRKTAGMTFKGETVTVDFRGAKIIYPGGDYTTLPTLSDGVYEQRELDRLVEYLDGLKEPISVVDVGANVGIWTVILGRHKNVKKVFAFEPSAENLNFLRKNIDLNQVSDWVEVHEVAVSDSVGTAKFVEGGSGATRRLSADNEIGSSMQTVSLDSMLSTFGEIGLIKIDVEGFEPLVIKGMQTLIAAQRPALFIEYSRAQTEAAGLNWESASQSLLSAYSEFELIDDKSTEIRSSFEDLYRDNRLVNLAFGMK